MQLRLSAKEQGLEAQHWLPSIRPTPSPPPTAGPSCKPTQSGQAPGGSLKPTSGRNWRPELLEEDWPAEGLVAPGAEELDAGTAAAVTRNVRPELSLLS